MEVIDYLNNGKKTITEVVENFGIRYDLVSRWKREFSDKDKTPFTGQGNARDEEIARLKKENADLRMEREILKKAMAIFSTPTKWNMKMVKVLKVYRSSYYLWSRTKISNHEKHD